MAGNFDNFFLFDMKICMFCIVIYMLSTALKRLQKQFVKEGGPFYKLFSHSATATFCSTVVIFLNLP